MNDWYLKIEPEVRDIVYALRNNGINTFCSCGHDMWIQCETNDPTEELKVIYNILVEQFKIVNYCVNVDFKISEGYISKFLEIKLPKLDKKE
jgi:hypothetical protein